MGMATAPIRVTGAVIVRDGAVMAAQRGAHKSQGGLWEFPGGKIEPGETPQEALARELREELSCRVSVGTRLTTTAHDYGTAVVELTTFFCTLEGTEPQLSEHQALAWLPPERLEELDWAPADMPAVRLLIEGAHP